ncbi:hypothetical protein B9479_003976 [Cryptococcus floricola]|uniref:Enoyl reductase (ER) domain-containing protein n=1 Tax=Cryptococcus floricola TaxID=2591691 RepID=A0A5D3AYM8_9TREE|nr:hypothetical protein B9479_003976 [Cryptococcus floricola]
MSAIPQTMKAWVQNESSALSIQEVSVPELKANQVLVKVQYAAQNPTDWKHAAALSVPGVINGCDYAGTVVKVGSGLTASRKVGDRVAGTVHGGYFKDEGSYAQYAAAESDLTWVVPESIKLEDAATFGVGWVTSLQTIIQRQKHAFPDVEQVSGNPWYIVYGGSTSVGLFAIQLAKALGYKVLAFASPHSYNLVKSYGADATVDYHNQEEGIAEALKITDGGAEYGLDTISEGDSFKIIVAALGKKGKQLNAILPTPKDIKDLNPNLFSEWTLMYTLFGQEFDWTPRSPGKNIWPASQEDRKFGTEAFKHTPTIIEKFGIKPNPVQVTGGFEDVTKGLELLKNNKLSGTKSVIKIDA